MQNGYTQEEIAMMVRDARLKEEYERGLIKLAGIEEGKAEGIAEGAKETLDNNIKLMKKSGFDSETIAKVLKLDISYVEEVLTK